MRIRNYFLKTKSADNDYLKKVKYCNREKNGLALFLQQLDHSLVNEYVENLVLHPQIVVHPQIIMTSIKIILFC